MSGARDEQCVVRGEPPRDTSGAYAIVMHPAVRIGFLDAQSGRALDHDQIIARIMLETPPRALDRIGWAPGFFGPADKPDAVERAQYRYEEGRLLVHDIGLRAKAWGHPDCPPASVCRWIDATFAQPQRPNQAVAPGHNGGEQDG